MILKNGDSYECKFSGRIYVLNLEHDKKNWYLRNVDENSGMARTFSMDKYSMEYVLKTNYKKVDKLA